MRISMLWVRLAVLGCLATACDDSEPAGGSADSGAEGQDVDASRDGGADQEGGTGADAGGTDMDAESGAGGADTSDAQRDVVDGGTNGDAGAGDRADDTSLPPASACATPEPTGDTLLDLGHGGLGALEFAGDRIVSDDGRWILWNASTGARIATGVREACATPAPCPVTRLRGNLLAVPTGSSLELRSADDGRLVATLAFPAGTFGLARDGSYVWIATDTALGAWSPTGEPLWTRSGDFRYARVGASHSWLGYYLASPSGPYVSEQTVHSIAMPSGTETTTSFQGSSPRWFADGARFIVGAASGLTRVYSASGAEEQTFAAASGPTAGIGDHAWSYDAASNRLRVFSLAAGAEPVLDSSLAAYAELHASGHTLAAFSYLTGLVQLIDLKAPTLAVREVRLPSGLLARFAANADGAWVVSDWNAVMYQQTSPGERPRVLNCGAALAVAVAQNGSFAVSVAAGQILQGDLRTRTISHVYPSRATQLSFSHDGAYLVARADGSMLQYPGDHNLRVYDAATRAKAADIAAPANPGFSKFWVATGSNRLANARCEAATTGAPACIVDVTDLLGQASYLHLESSGLPRIGLSPTGDRVAAALSFHNELDATTTFYEGGALVGMASGLPTAEESTTRRSSAASKVRSRPTTLASRLFSSIALNV